MRLPIRPPRNALSAYRAWARGAPTGDTPMGVRALRGAIERHLPQQPVSVVEPEAVPPRAFRRPHKKESWHRFPTLADVPPVESISDPREARMAIATLLYEARAAKQWSLARLAHEMGTSAASWYHHLERGAKLPPPERLDRLADTLGIDRSILRALANVAKREY